MNYSTPREIADTALQSGITKSRLSIRHMLMLGMLAGAYIAFAAEGSTMAAHDIASVGFARFLSGVIFSTGLMLVIICGAELFTGNTLLCMGYLEGKISLTAMLKNWLWVYIGNLIGSVLVAIMMDASALWSYNNFLHGAYALKLALGKVKLTFSEAFFRGILCNWLVCLAVWMAYAAKDITGKVWGIFFPIMLFITSSFEHCVANMYYLTAGLLLKNSHMAAVLGSSYDTTELTVYSAIINNLIPVTLGNIVGGALFVGGCYWYTYLKK
jgi:formate/nitrite transporter